MTPSDEVYEDICHKLWYLGLFRSVRAFEKLIRYLGNKGSDYKIEWAGDFDVKNKVDCVRIIINYKDIHTSMHIIVDIYDDYKTERAIASWEKYLNNLFNKEKSVEKCCGTCRYFKPDTTWCSEKCGNCYSWSSWEPKEDKEMEEKRCENCRYSGVSAQEEPCDSCLLEGGCRIYWEPKEDKKMEKKYCDSCRYFKLGVMEEPCVKCTLNGDVWSKWEPKGDKIFMALSVEEVRKKLDFYCTKWTVMAFDAFMADVSEPVWKCTLEWPYDNKELIITITDENNLSFFRWYIPISGIGCTTEKEILRARDAWKESILIKEDNKMVEDLFEYTKRDVEEVTKAAEDVNKLWAEFFGTYKQSNKPAIPKMPGIEDVIFNGPATIVKWSDGTKTVVKAQKGKNGKTEKLDPEKGLAMAICKKLYGNDGRYYDIFKRYCE